MTLGDWLNRRNMTREKFAELIGADHSSVTRYVHGRIPRRDILSRIVAATNGEVTANDFMAFADQQEPPRRVG